MSRISHIIKVFLDYFWQRNGGPGVHEKDSSRTQQNISGTGQMIDQEVKGCHHAQEVHRPMVQKINGKDYKNID